MKKNFRSVENARYAALWRWAKSICPGCLIKQKHKRGYHRCDRNPDHDMFGFTKRMG